MKDMPHHINKLNRKILRESRQEEAKDLPDIPRLEESSSQKKKKKKREMKAEREEHIPLGKTPEERNKEMRMGRVPILYDKNHQKPKANHPSRKKRPKI